jgi:hypothetical protein
VRPSKLRAMTEEQASAFMERNLRKFYPEVGRIAAVWAMMEWTMDRLIWDLAGVEQQLGACMTTQLNGPTPRLRTIKALAALLGAPQSTLTKINKFGRTMIAPQEERNRAIHDAWFVGMQTKVVHKMTVATIDNRLTFEQKQSTVASLRETFDRSKKILMEFNSLVAEIRSSVQPTSPEIRQKLLRRVSPLNESKLDRDSDQQSPLRPPYASPSSPRRKSQGKKPFSS